MVGWVKLHRKLKSKAFYCKDSEKVHLWIHLLMKANHSPREEMFKGKPIVCNAGQFTTGRKQLSQETGISESKIQRILTYFEKTEQQIEQQTTSVNRLISILNWHDYQQSEQQSEQQVNNDRTTSEQQVNNDRTTSEHTIRIKKLEEERESKELNKFSKFESDDYLKEIQNHLKNCQISISFEDIKTQAKIFVSERLVAGDTNKPFYDYSSHFINKMKLFSKNNKSEPEQKKKKNFLQKTKLTDVEKNNIPHFKVAYVGYPKNYYHTEEDIQKYCEYRQTELRSKTKVRSELWKV